jgi:5-formyltetrahydrofolate cyclo-ligase
MQHLSKSASEIRQLMRNQFRSLSFEEKRSFEQLANQLFIQQLVPWFDSLQLKPRTLGFYRALKGQEIDLTESIQFWAGRSGQAAFPKCGPKGHMQYHLFPGVPYPGSDWVRAASLPVEEPPLHWSKLDGPSALDVIFVPGLAFSKQGHRIGRGSGYYDRFLRAHPWSIRVGVAFDFQVLNQCPQSSWDQSVDIMLTPSGLWDTQRGVSLKSGLAPPGRLG